MKMNKNLSRRTFIKISSVATIAAGSGFAVGKLIGKTGNYNYSIYGFLPLDKQIISEVVNAFCETVRSDSDAIIIADKDYEILLRNIVNDLKQLSFSNSGSVIYKLEKLNNPVNSDIIVSDNIKSIYSIQNDFNIELTNIRSKLSEIPASVFFSAEYKQNNIFSSLFKSDKKEIVVENEKGVFDIIQLNSSYKSIKIDGPQGKTEIEIDKNMVKVAKSTCKHKLCERAGHATNAGDIIACAPNKVLIKIEEV